MQSTTPMPLTHSVETDETSKKFIKLNCCLDSPQRRFYLNFYQNSGCMERVGTLNHDGVINDGNHFLLKLLFHSLVNEVNVT